MGKSGRNTKLTFTQLYKDYFKKQYPRTAKRTVRWFPCDYITIELWLDDGSVARYNGDRHEIRYLERRWK